MIALSKVRDQARDLGLFDGFKRGMRVISKNDVIFEIDPGVSSKEESLDETNESNILKSNVSEEISTSNNELIDPESSSG
jgi:hypothetical protein